MREQRNWLHNGMKGNVLNKVWHFYADGFRNMGPLGRKLWLLILVKIVVLFVVFKMFFFPDLLERDYDDDSQRADAVRSSLLDERRH